MDYSQLLAGIQNYIHAYFENHHDEKYVYHNIEHTEDVARSAEEIGNHFQLNETDFFSVVAAAWFHDIGYMINPADHEKEGATAATAYLKEKGVPESVIHAVQGCILATRVPQNPHGVLEDIICDADMYHLGTDDFMHYNKRMRKESEAIQGKDSIDREAWTRSTLELLKNHHYHTDYCRLLLDETKRKNEHKLREKLKKLMEEKEPQRADDPSGEEKSGKKQKESSQDKSIQTMFRISSSNNQHLSKLADYKAHVMVSVNSIILSVTLGLLLKQLGFDSKLAIPTYIILVVCLLAIIFSVLATRPNLPRHGYSAKEIEEKKINLLFFGNFFRLSMDEYIDEVQKVMRDPDYLDIAIIKDIYAEGVVLARKYRLLRISYDIFMYGIVVSVLAFIIATVAV